MILRVKMTMTTKNPRREKMQTMPLPRKQRSLQMMKKRDRKATLQTIRKRISLSTTHFAMDVVYVHIQNVLSYSLTLVQSF